MNQTQIRNWSESINQEKQFTADHVDFIKRHSKPAF